MIKFVEYDSEKIVSSLVEKFDEVLGTTLQPSDERRIFIDQLAQVIVAQNAAINDAANQVLLRFARGETLDEIGRIYGVTRLQAKYASCTLKFTLSAVQTSDKTIPKGTRATPDGNVYFATDNDLIITAGNTVGEVKATALTAGSDCNGFIEGQIKYIVDNVPTLANVSNTTVSAGGSDEESDDSYRERIRISPESYSTAGCEEGYIYHAKSASSDVGDVSVYSPVNDTSLSEKDRADGAGKVYIYLLKADGSIPAEDDEILNIVKEKVSAKDVRPLTDNVIVAPPTKVEYYVDISYYVSIDNASEVANIENAVKKAVDEYVAWQGEKIGRDINPDKLRYLVLKAGASRVTINEPSAFKSLKSSQVAALSGTPTITYSGFSE